MDKAGIAGAGSRGENSYPFAAKVAPCATLRMPILFSYSWYFGVNIQEAAKPLSSYTTFNDFFTRKLRRGARPISRPLDPRSIVRP